MAKKRFDDDVMDNGGNVPDVLGQSISQIIGGEAGHSGKAIIRRNADGSLQFYGYQLTSVGVETLDGLYENQWRELGQVLASLQSGIQWLIGDWAAHGENVRYGETADFAQLLGLKRDTVHDYTYVARNVEFSIRIENLSFAHHQVVAGMEADQQRRWLELAAAEGLSVAKLRRAIKAAQQEGDEQHTPHIDQWRKLKPKTSQVQVVYNAADKQTQQIILEDIRDLYHTLTGEQLKTDQPQINPAQLQVLKRLYFDGPVTDRHGTKDMSQYHELAKMGLVKIEQEGAHYKASIVRSGEQYLRSIGEIVQ
jgi:hypothetical protein